MVDVTRYLPKDFLPDADFLERFVWAADEDRIIDNCKLIKKAVLEDRENQERKRKK